MTNTIWGFVAFFAAMQLIQVVLLLGILQATEYDAWHWMDDESNTLTRWLHSQEEHDNA